MRKPSFIIGKKHVILACLTLILGIAIYMNYAFSAAQDDIAAARTMSDLEVEDAVNYGDAAFVSTESDFFSQARLTRMTTRDEAVETLAAMLNGGDLSAEQTNVYTVEAVTLSKLSESEGRVENLIRAQGFEDCVVYLNGSTANIVVKTEGLVPSEVAQIKDILLNEITIPSENIRIFEVK
ncbi:MAG: SpoIIIAH-like family protein [Oscillospiraceae bacterium]|nr:SpoIIIAH-like family protein [Oscillospiraceae bacterium]